MISGEIGGRVSPVSSLTGVHLSTVELSPGATVVLSAPRGRNVFLYVVLGKVRIEGEIGREVHLLDMSADGDEIAMEGLTDALLLFGHAEPLGEPVVAQGPFVMNTREEIIQAYRDYQAGKFGSAVSIR